MTIRMAMSAACAPVLCLALAACATPAAAPADPSMAGPVATKLTGYLNAVTLDGKAVLGPPPSPDSIRGRAESATYDDLRKMEGTPRWKEAQADNDLWNGGALKRFACAMGRDVSEASTPVTARMLHRLELDVRTISVPVKDFYGRRRPAIGNDKPICVPREAWMATNASYPSGHSMTGWTWALVLSEAQPASATRLLEAGREMGTSRVICGVHYESDVEAGRTLGAGMVATLHADPAFQADLAQAKREIARAPAPTGCAS